MESLTEIRGVRTRREAATLTAEPLEARPSRPAFETFAASADGTE